MICVPVGSKHGAVSSFAGIFRLDLTIKLAGVLQIPLVGMSFGDTAHQLERTEGIVTAAGKLPQHRAVPLLGDLRQGPGSLALGPAVSADKEHRLARRQVLPSKRRPRPFARQRRRCRRQNRCSRIPPGGHSGGQSRRSCRSPPPPPWPSALSVCFRDGGSSSRRRFSCAFALQSPAEVVVIDHLTGHAAVRCRCSPR